MTGSRGIASVVRPVAAPVACAAALTGLLSAWVATGGGGTLRRMPLRFEVAAVAAPLGLPGTHGPALTYLVIKNLGGPDELLSAQAPASRQVVLARRGNQFSGTTLPMLAIPAHSTTSLNPFGPDIVLLRPRTLEIGGTIPITLTFRHAGKITVQLTVTPPGTP